MKNTTHFLLLICFTFNSYSQIDSIPLEEVIINDFSIPLKQKHATDAISVVNSEAINHGNTLELSPILNQVPGVFMHSGTLNTNRITIRGIGARSLFGTSNIRAYFGEIPLTDGNGESTLEDLELTSISRIEIHKGPSSSSYGVGLGGTIILQPIISSSQENGVSFSSTFGSYDMKRLVLKAHLNGTNSNTNIIAGINDYNGYRENNEYNKKTLTITSGVSLGENDDFEILGNYIALKAGIPSSLNFEDFSNDPRQAAFTWGNSKALEDVNYGIAGITWKHRYNKKSSLSNSIFGSLKKNNESRPFNILEENSKSFGIRSRLLGSNYIYNTKLDWNAGGELFYESYTGKTFENLYQDFPAGTGSIQGSQLSELDEKRFYYNFFIEANYQATKKLRFNAGVNLNQTFFDVNDQFIQDGEDNSGDYKFDPILSPKIGFNYTIDQHFTLFGNISHGFSTPTTTETLLPDGVFNPDIRPEIGWNYELGTRYKLFNSSLYGSFSVYTLRVTDLLVTRRTIEDNFFVINAGKTTHNGVEGEINYHWLAINNGSLQLFANASIYDYKFEDFVDSDQNFSGNELTGVPSSVINMGIRLTGSKGFYGNLTFQHVGKTPVNDANSVFNDSYQLLHGKLGYINQLGDHFFYNVFSGVNNILDTSYASQIQINARGFGNNPPRYFYPGLPFNLYIGININYRF